MFPAHDCGHGGLSVRKFFTSKQKCRKHDSYPHFKHTLKCISVISYTCAGNML